MSVFWESFFINLGGFAVLVAALGWLIRSLFNQYLSKDIELYKAKLQLINSQHYYKFEKLHEKRADLIAELYLLIVRAEESFKQFKTEYESSGNPSDAHLVHTEKVGKFLKENRIYFDAGTCELVEDFGSALSIPMSLYIDKNYQEDFSVPLNDTVKKLAKNHDFLKNCAIVEAIIPTIKDRLECQFKTMLGINIYPEQCSSHGGLTNTTINP